MTKYFRPLVLVCFIALGACAPKTDIAVEQNSVLLPPQFSARGNERINEDWYLAFKDEQLNRLIENALDSNFSLLAARERLIQAAATARSVGADRAVSIDGQAFGSESWNWEKDSSNSTGRLLLGISASYEVDLWGRLGALEDAALYDLQGSHQDLQTAALSLSAQIANSWYQLANAASQLRLLEKQQELNTIGLELIQIRFNAGQVGIADLLQQQQLIESKSGEIALQKANHQVLLNQLAILSALSPGLVEQNYAPELINLPSLPDTGLPAELLTNRPDVQSSYLDLLAADRRLAAAIANKYPKLSLSADLETSGSSTGDLFNDWFSSLAANLAGPVIDGGQREAEVERSSAVAREKLNDYRQNIIEAVGEVEDALIQESEQKKYITSLQLQLELANQTLTNLKDRYKQGLEDYQRVLTALLSQQGLEQNLLNARQQLISYRIDLYRALGGNLTEITLDTPQATDK